MCLAAAKLTSRKTNRIASLKLILTCVKRINYVLLGERQSSLSTAWYSNVIKAIMQKFVVDIKLKFNMADRCLLSNRMETYHVN